MEVKVVSVSDLPDDALLSIRSGTTRRQTQLSSRRPLSFPDGPSKLIQIDILQKVASAHLVPKPGLEARQYQVHFDSLAGCERQGISCELSLAPRVTHLAGDTGACPSPHTAPDTDYMRPTSSAATSAKDYLERTGVLDFIQTAIQAVVRDRPNDPFEAMIRHLSNGYRGYTKKHSNASIQPASEPGCEDEGTQAVERALRAGIVGNSSEDTTSRLQACSTEQEGPCARAPQKIESGTRHEEKNFQENIEQKQQQHPKSLENANANILFDANGQEEPLMTRRSVQTSRRVFDSPRMLPDTWIEPPKPPSDALSSHKGMLEIARPGETYEVSWSGAATSNGSFGGY